MPRPRIRTDSMEAEVRLITLGAGRCSFAGDRNNAWGTRRARGWSPYGGLFWDGVRSEEHTSELQSRENLVCRLLLEKKKNHICEPYPNTKKKKDGLLVKSTNTE